MPRIYRHINEKRRSKGGDFKFAASEKKKLFISCSKNTCTLLSSTSFHIEKKTGRTLKDETLKKNKEMERKPKKTCRSSETTK